MTDTNYPLDQFTEDNKLLGFALWKVLESHVDFDCAGVGNQPQAKDFNAEAPQTVDFLFGHSSHGLPYSALPPDFYPYAISFPVCQNPVGTFTVTTASPDGTSLTSFLITEVKYAITLRKFTTLLPQLADKKIASLMLQMLEVVDTDEYCYSKMPDGSWE
ncbi:MAG: hypothetical protein RLZZ515_49 [Cyanobacteriota bacterium]|jgi:hypothetical protein